MTAFSTTIRNFRFFVQLTVLVITVAVTSPLCAIVRGGDLYKDPEQEIAKLTERLELNPKDVGAYLSRGNYARQLK